MRTYKYLLVFFSSIALAVNVQAMMKRDSIQRVKDMSLYVFRDTLDREWKFGDLKGNYIFLEIWSMSCVPCLRQMPYFEELSREYKDRPIRFISICVENNVLLWKNFLKQKKMNGIHWVTPILSPFLRENGFMAVPRFVLLDKKGQILWSKAKQPSDPELKKDLDQLFD